MCPGGIFASPACEELFHRDDGGILAEKGNCETYFCVRGVMPWW